MSDHYVCPLCGAMGEHEPPHEWGEPCPQKLRLDDAYLTKLEDEILAVRRMAAAQEHAFRPEDE